MSIANIGNYDSEQADSIARRAEGELAGRMRTAGKPTTFAPRRGKFIPPQRVAEQRRQAVGVGSSQCFYHGAPPLQPKGQYVKGGGSVRTDHVVVANTSDDGFKTIYQGDFAKRSFNQDQFAHANSYDAAFGKVPHGGFIKFHDVETRAATGNIPNEKFDMVYKQSHVLGAVAEDSGAEASTALPERATRRRVDYDDHVSLGKARERMNMRTLNFSELPGQELNPKPMRKNHQEYGSRHKQSQITWAYHG